MITLAPMTDAQFSNYLEQVIPDFADDKIRSGQWSRAEALELSRASFEHSLPQGVATPDHHLYVMQHGPDQQVVGMMWIGAQLRGEQRVAYVYDVFVAPEHRRQGHATKAFAAMEAQVRSMGLAGVALHVFGHNHQAHALYVKLGYLTTNINMFKPLPSAL